jgi:hypothetical protein
MKACKTIVTASLAAMLCSCCCMAQNCTQSTSSRLYRQVSCRSLSTNITYTVIASDGSIGGVDSDIAKEIAKRNCLEIQAVVVDPAAIVQNVRPKGRHRNR